MTIREKTGEEANRDRIWMKEDERYDINNSREAWRSFWIHKLMNYYRMPYEAAEREIDQWGLSRMVQSMEESKCVSKGSVK